jgi:nitric oxide reductase activation protein
MKAIFNRLASELKNFLIPETKEALSIPENAHQKTEFIDVQRRLRIYLRALWEREFAIKQAEVDSNGYEVSKPFIEYFVINLPPAFFDDTLDGITHVTADSVSHVTGLELYRAAVTHAAAHLIYRKVHLSEHSLDQLQIAMISVIEDARIETLSIRSFPGLKQLWAKQHTATPHDNKTAGDYLNRLARALLDDTYQDDDAWIAQGRALFNSANDLEDDHISRVMGISLAESFREKKIKFNADLDIQRAAYRDDNRYLWTDQSEPMDIINPFWTTQAAVGLEETDKEPKDRAAPKPDPTETRKPVSATYFYPEWNYRSRSEDQAWVTLRERTPASGDLKVIDDIVAENHHLIARMKSLLRAIRDGAAHRIRKLEVGDELDINAAIRAQSDLRQGMPPDSRIMMRSVRKTRDISVLILLDLSKSMNNLIVERQHTALEVTRQSCVLFAEAMDSVGDSFAIHGFYSDSRHFVEYSRLKDFDQPYDDIPKARLAAITGRRGTRMGAAVRHATHLLNNQKSSKKLLLIMTDGEPADVDTPDRKYLHDDTKKSVADAKRRGIHTYCISLDPGADKYVSRIFGATNYMVVDHVKCLPEKVLLIYAGLAR